MSVEEDRPPQEIVEQVTRSFLIYSEEQLIDPMNSIYDESACWGDCLLSAMQGLRSAVHAASLPFALTHHMVIQRRFDRFHMAEGIRALENPFAEEKPKLTQKERDELALEKANKAMQNFMESKSGQNFVRNQTVYELHHRLGSDKIQTAANELLVQSLISCWSVFESFARAFAVAWINDDPNRARRLTNSADLKEFFGRPFVDFDIIGQHSFDLSRAMGTIMFNNRRLDKLGNIKSVMKAFFDSHEVQNTMGSELFLLNQRRHLFVHNRGIVDSDYLRNTGESRFSVGEQLCVSASDLERGLLCVQEAILAIVKAARECRPE